MKEVNGKTHYGYLRHPYVPDQWARRDIFPTLSAALDAAKANTATWGQPVGQYVPGSVGGDDTWAGGSWDDAERLITEGWKDGATEATEAANRISDRLVGTSYEAMVEAMDADVTGAAFDVGGYCAGIPECWIRPSVGMAKRAIHFGVNVIASAGIESATLRKRGIAVASLAMALMAQGYPLTIDVCQVLQTANGYEAISIRVADAETGSQLDLDRLVYALAHPTVLRRLCKAITGHKLWNPGTVMSDSRPTDADYDLYIGGTNLAEFERYSQVQADQWVVDEYKRQTADR